MAKREIEVPDGFPSRFQTFLKHFELNPNSLAKSIDDESGRVKYNRWLTGEYEPTFSGLRRIADTYPVSLNWLVLGDGPMLRNEDEEEDERKDNASIRHLQMGKSPEAMIQGAEAVRIIESLKKENKDTQDRLRMAERIIENQSETLRNFQEVTSDTTGDVALHSPLMADVYDYAPKMKKSDREVAFIWANVLMQKRN